MLLVQVLPFIGQGLNYNEYKKVTANLMPLPVTNLSLFMIVSFRKKKCNETRGVTSHSDVVDSEMSLTSLLVAMRFKL